METKVRKTKQIKVEEYIPYVRINTDGFDGNFISIAINKPKGKTLGINFSSDQLIHCCGIYEFGSIHITYPTSSPNNKQKSLYNKELIPHIKTLFKQLFAEEDVQNDNRTTKLSFMINTSSGSKDTLVVEEALKDEELFTCVKTFKNYNSGNTIKMWVSNN